MVSERSRNGHSEEPVCKSQTTYTPYRLTILAAMVLTAGAGCAGEAKITKIDRGVIVQTYRYQVQVRDGAVVGILNRLTGEEYVSARADLARLLPHLPSGLGTQDGEGKEAAAKLFQKPWWEHDAKSLWPNQHYPAPDSAVQVEQAKGRPGVAVVTYKGLTDGSKTYDDETFSLEVRVDGDTGDLLLTSSVQSPRKGVYGCGVTVAPLAPAVTVEAPIFDGVRLDANMKPGLWVNRWASYWDYAFVALNGKDKGTVGLWCQDAELKYYKHLFYLIDGQGLSLALSSMNVPPFDDLTRCQGVTWRLQAFDKSWAQAAARFRDWRNKNVKVAKRPDWVAGVCFMNGGVNAGKMWLDCLADYFENKHLERTVTFAPVIRRQPFDHNHADNMYYEKFPDEMKAWKASGAKLMAYLQPMIMWTPDARTDREKDALRFHELATPLGAFGGSGDHHLGEPHWQRWFLDWVKQYIDVGGADGVYHDETYSCPIDARGLAVNGMTYPQGMADYFRKAQTENPNSIHGTEHLTEVNVVGASFGIGSGMHWGTGAGMPGTMNTQRIEHASPVSNALSAPFGATFAFPHMSELSHGDSLKFHHGMNLQEMRGDLAGNYLQYTSLYNGRTVPYEAFVNELWLDRARATTFVWTGLHQVFPEDFSREVYSYFKGAGGEEFRYEKAPWGTRFVRVRGGGKTLIYGRIHGVTEADVPGGVAGWCVYGPDGRVAGLDPERFYIVDPSRARPAEYFSLGKSAGAFRVEEGLAAPKFAFLKVTPLGSPADANGSVILNSRMPRKVFVNGEARAPRVVSEKDGRGRYEIPFKGPATIVAILAEPGGLEDLADFSAVRAVLSDWRQDLFDSAWLTRTATVRKDRAGKTTFTRIVPVGPGGKRVQMHWVVRNPAAEARTLKVSFTGKLMSAELNGARVEWKDEKGKPSIVLVKLPAGEPGLLSLTSDAGGTGTFDWAD